MDNNEMKESASIIDTLFYNCVGLINRYKIELFSSLLCGLFAYGFYFTNTIYNHDSISELSDWTGTYELGRWGKAVINWILPPITMPWFDGLLSLMFFSIAICFISNIFEIRNKVFKFLLAGIIICFPSITSDYFYIFQAVHISVSFLLAILCVYFLKGAVICSINNKNSFWKYMGISVTSLVFSIGIYQALLAVTTSFFVVFLIQKTIQKYEGKLILKTSGIIVCILAVSIFLYFVITLLTQYFIGNGFSSYADKQTDTNASLFLRLLYPYYYFFREVLLCHAGILTSKVAIFAHIVMIFILLNVGYSRIKHFSFQRILYLVLLLCIYPFSINFLYLVSPIGAVYTLPLIGFISVYIICVIVVEKWSVKVWQGDVLKLLLLVVLFSNIRTANILAMRIHVMYENAYSFYTTLVTQIKESDLLEENSRLSICGAAEKFIYQVDDIPDKNFFPLPLLIHANHRYEFIKYFIGFDIPTVSLEEKKKIVETDEFKSMNIYPYKGSIHKINNVIVVKFSEEVNDWY